MYLNLLSFGICDIAEGKINKEEVKYIIPCSAFSSPEEAIEFYSKTYWSINTTKCAELCRELWHKVIQPRVIFGNEHFPYCGDPKRFYDTLEDFKKACSTMKYNVITELKQGGYIK